MTLAPLTETERLRESGRSYARAGNAKPDFRAWSLTYGTGEHAAKAHRAFCHGFDAIRDEARENTKRTITQRVVISRPAARRQRVAVPA